MTRKTIVITGASDGIGAASARLIKAQGHHVVIVGRSPEKTERVAKELDVPYYLADFKKLNEVRALAHQLQHDLPRIDVLANNAGGIMGPHALTTDGNEMTVQVNHLAPFLLTKLLLDKLIASRASVIATSSNAHKAAGALDPYDMTLSRRFTPGRAYARVKLMNILFTKELERRYGGAGLRAVAFHPGVVNTNFSSEFGGLLNKGFTSGVRHLFRTPAEGAETLVWLATTEDWKPGQYYKDRKISKTTRQANDPELARRLWERSAALARMP